jgi:hypothetical protein
VRAKRNRRSRSERFECRRGGVGVWESQIEILYVPRCPNYQPRFERLQAVLASAEVKTGIHGIAVITDLEAKALLFPGSPAVRINGEDVEPLQTSVPSLVRQAVACMKVGAVADVAPEVPQKLWALRWGRVAFCCATLRASSTKVDRNGQSQRFKGMFCQ